MTTPTLMDEINARLEEAGNNSEFQVDIDLDPLSPSELNSALVELEAAGYAVTVKAEIRVDWRGDRSDPNR